MDNTTLLFEIFYPDGSTLNLLYLNACSEVIPFDWRCPILVGKPIATCLECDWINCSERLGLT